MANKAVIVSPQGMILLVRDAGVGDHTHHNGKWDVPGGRMEANESPLEALAREVREEIGFEIDITLARPFYVNMWGVGGDVVNNPVIGIYYIVPSSQTEVALSSEHSEFQWVDPRLPLAEDLASNLKGMIASYRQLIQQG